MNSIRSVRPKYQEILFFCFSILGWIALLVFMGIWKNGGTGGSPQDVVMTLSQPITVGVTSTYFFHPEDGINVKTMKDVGLTFYSRGDGYTPGKTTRSGRFVYEGSVAVSQTMWGNDVHAGDLIFASATGRWYRVEDTMHEKYSEPRIDIYTHDMSVAKSGSSKTDIIIVRQPK